MCLGINSYYSSGNTGFKLIGANFFSGSADIANGSFYFIFKLTDISKTGIVISGTFPRGVFALSNCIVSGTNGKYYVEVTDKDSNFKIGNNTDSMATNSITDISVY